MSSPVRTLLKIAAFASAMLLCAASSRAQISTEEFRNALIKQAAFTADELTELESGRAVVKLLPAKDRREVAFCGALRTRGAPATLLAAFKESMARKSKVDVLGGGSFGLRNDQEEMPALTRVEFDVKDLKRCALGNCGLKMPPDWAARLRSEVDWDAPDSQLRAARLFREMLSNHVRAYLARGDAALDEFRDGDVRPGEEQALLGSMPYVNEAAPEFAAYLRGFPRLDMPDVESALHLSRVKFGLKPVLLITHTATYTRRHGDASQILVATKQIYAEHYLDSSLSLTLLSGALSGDDASDTYILYVNRSRTDVVDGMFGKLVRGVVEREVLEGLRATLELTKLGAEARLANQADAVILPGDEEATSLPAEWLFSKKRYLLFAALLVAPLLLLQLNRLLRRRAVQVR